MEHTPYQAGLTRMLTLATSLSQSFTSIWHSLALTFTVSTVSVVFSRLRRRLCGQGSLRLHGGQAGSSGERSSEDVSCLQSGIISGCQKICSSSFVPGDTLRRCLLGLQSVTVFAFKREEHGAPWEGGVTGVTCSPGWPPHLPFCPAPVFLSILDSPRSPKHRVLSTCCPAPSFWPRPPDTLGPCAPHVFMHAPSLCPVQAFPQKLVEPVCAFWNFSISPRMSTGSQQPSVPSPLPSPHTGGSWATAGCSVLSLYQDSTACFCNHSTSFAVLLQVYDIQRGPEEESLLRTLSFVGCGVSLCALATTFLLFLAAGVPKSERTTVHKNLTFSLASAEGFLMASEWAKDSKVACVAVTAAMHFLFLVAFSWMLVEGLLLWNKVVAVSMRPGPKMRLYYVIGWGMPVVIVAITMAKSPHDYVAAGHCWLDVHTDTIWAFAGPVLLVLLANTYILFRVVMVTVSSARRRARMLSPQPGLRQQIKIQMWATVKPVLVLLPILGLTWLVGILVHLSPVWAYIAVGLNSFQGPYIFLVYAAYNGEVRSALQRMTEKKAAALAVGQAGPTTVTISCGTCSGPSSQQPPGPWEVPRTPPRRHVALRGQISAPCGPRAVAEQ
ncbi:hypothetical protein GHT09_001499 [Marmota monax]|uniref:G-protein coupled receptors family 2 profile 2 domain-containing protein n=1 Tax=Marmota monax TaxID=9995 RepID=A0A834QVQ6_MARMO|nr:hypothetical protein GHT09_001499 [Marmota monax]